MRVESRHFPAQGEPSVRAAMATECAGDQKRFAEYSRAIYSADPARGPERFTAGALKQYAATLGLNGDDFNRCLDSDKYRSRVQADFDEGKTQGVNSTPTFFVNGERIVGVPPDGHLRSVVERLRPKPTSGQASPSEDRPSASLPRRRDEG